MRSIKVTLLVAVAALVAVAFTVPAVASASNWTKEGETLTSHWAKGGMALVGNEKGTLAMGGSLDFSGEELGSVKCNGVNASIAMETGSGKGTLTSLGAVEPKSCTVGGTLGVTCGSHSLTGIALKGNAAAAVVAAKAGRPVVEVPKAAFIYTFGTCLTLNLHGDIVATPDDALNFRTVTFSGELHEDALGETVALGGTMAAAPASLSLKGALAFDGEIGNVSCPQTTTAVNFEEAGRVSSFSVSSPSGCTVGGFLGVTCGSHSLTGIAMEGKPAATITRSETGNPKIQVPNITLTYTFGSCLTMHLSGNLTATSKGAAEFTEVTFGGSLNEPALGETVTMSGATSAEQIVRYGLLPDSVNVSGTLGWEGEAGTMNCSVNGTLGLLTGSEGSMTSVSLSKCEFGGFAKAYCAKVTVGSLPWTLVDQGSYIAIKGVSITTDCGWGSGAGELKATPNKVSAISSTSVKGVLGETAWSGSLNWSPAGVYGL